MCLITLQEKPKRTFRAITAYKVLERRSNNGLESPTWPCPWKKGELKKTEFTVRLNVNGNDVTYANNESHHYYWKEENLTEVAAGFHAYRNKEDAIEHWCDIYNHNIREAIVVEMKIPAFSLIFTDECRLICSNKMKLIQAIPEMEETI